MPSFPAATAHSARGASAPLKGVAFEIADLLLAQAWAGRHEIEICIRLDHSTPTEEYEEVIALRGTNLRIAPVIIWRIANAIRVQPLVGRGRQYHSVSDALDSLIPEKDAAVTDIVATQWPADPQ